jgi:hydroxyquinol 1,2-dioxygenase
MIIIYADDLYGPDETVMTNLTTDKITDAVIGAMESSQDVRLKQIMDALVRHFHAFMVEAQLRDDEWLAAIQFLTATGKMCNDERQEFILLSDILGITALKDALNHPPVEGLTETTVLGPFYRSGAPEIGQMANIAGNARGDPVLVDGKVIDLDGNPISGAQLDIWQATGEGFYDVQLESMDGEMGLRGKLRTDAKGCYSFRTIKPSSYPIPHDGPTGDLLKKLGRHPNRPAHIHFIVSAVGYQPVVTQLFVSGDPYLASDAVFGVRDSLVVEFKKVDSEDEAAQVGLQSPFYKAHYDFALKKA